MTPNPLTSKEKIAIVERLNHLNAKYGDKATLGKVNWAKSTVATAKLDAKGKPVQRAFVLSAGVAAGTFKIKFAGQQAVTKPVVAKAKK